VIGIGILLTLVGELLPASTLLAGIGWILLIAVLLVLAHASDSA
jgi:hypothetical protein